MSKYNRQDLENYVVRYAKWPVHKVKRETSIALERVLEEGRFPLPPNPQSAAVERPPQPSKASHPPVPRPTTVKPSVSTAKDSSLLSQRVRSVPANPSQTRVEHHATRRSEPDKREKTVPHNDRAHSHAHSASKPNPVPLHAPSKTPVPFVHPPNRKPKSNDRERDEQSRLFHHDTHDSRHSHSRSHEAPHNKKRQEEEEEEEDKEDDKEEENDGDLTAVETDNEAEWTPVIHCLLCDRRVASMCFDCQCKTFGYTTTPGPGCGKLSRIQSTSSDSALNSYVAETERPSQHVCNRKSQGAGSHDLKRVGTTTAGNARPNLSFPGHVESTEWTQTVQKEFWSLKDQLHKRQETISKLLAIQEHFKGDADFDGEDSSLVYGQMEKNQQDIWNTSRSCAQALQNYRDFLERRRTKELAIIEDGNVGMDVVEAWQKKHTERIKTLNEFENEYDKCEEWMRKLSMPVAPPPSAATATTAALPVVSSSSSSSAT